MTLLKVQYSAISGFRDKCVPVTTAWRVFMLRLEEWPPIQKVTTKILNKHSWTTDKGWSSRVGFGRGANNPSSYKHILLLNIHSESICECGNEHSGSVQCGEFLD